MFYIENTIFISAGLLFRNNKQGRVRINYMNDLIGQPKSRSGNSCSDSCSDSSFFSSTLGGVPVLGELVSCRRIERRFSS